MINNVFVIGGSYFVGRCFCLVAAQDPNYRLHVLNRGRFPLKLDTVQEYCCDRHNTAAMQRLIPALDYHALIDFCAYTPGEIHSVIEHLPGNIGHYIYISTCSVYQPSGSYPKYEDAPLLSHGSANVVTQYAYHKKVLEDELAVACRQKNIPYTILRPAFIYGPLNYAPRESYYIEAILNNKPIPVPHDCMALFQFVYVRDIALALLKCIGNRNSYNEIYNLAAPELLGYEQYMTELTRCHGKSFMTTAVTVEQVERENMPLPFPLRQHELYSGDKIHTQLGFSYTPFSIGMTKTFAAFKLVFSND